MKMTAEVDPPIAAIEFNMHEDQRNLLEVDDQWAI
jgi:hypothetical protein